MGSDIKRNKNNLDFIAYLGHEFRTPLNVILGFSEAIREEFYGPLDNEKYREYVHHIYETATSLSEMVNTLLDLTKYELGYVSLREEEVDLETFLRLCIHQMEGYSLKSSSCTFRLQIKTPITLFADHLRLKQIILNLLSNACKHSPPEGVVTILLEVSARGEPILRIRDQGNGMTEHEVAHAFKPFEHGFTMSESKYIPGTGLGLPLAKKLMEAHGGTLRLESKVGEGTCCTLTFPQQRHVMLLKAA